MNKPQLKKYFNLKNKPYFCCAVLCCSVVSDSLRSHRLQPARLLSPWNFQGKNTAVGCHFLLQGIFLIQGSNSCLACLMHWQADFSPLAPPGKLLDIYRSVYLSIYLSIHLSIYRSTFWYTPLPERGAHQQVDH